MANVLILNGGPRKNGNTAALIRAFAEAAQADGHVVQEFYLQGMTIHGCLSCHQCGKAGKDCVQTDDMEKIYPAFRESQVIVFASPIYLASITGPLKTAIDRLFALWQTLPQAELTNKKSAFLLTANQPTWCQTPVTWYHELFTQAMGWEDLGVVYGHGSLYGAGKADDPDSVAAAAAIGHSI